MELTRCATSLGDKRQTRFARSSSDLGSPSKIDNRSPAELAAPTWTIDVGAIDPASAVKLKYRFTQHTRPKIMHGPGAVDFPHPSPVAVVVVTVVRSRRLQPPRPVVGVSDAAIMLLSATA